MSGHSKWNNIKRKKEKTDGQRAKIFTKIGREMSVCVKAGGGDPNVNTKLRDLIAKAKSMNVPNDNIQRIIKKAEGGEKDDYESITYEADGPSGVAMMVETLTDNRNRTAANLRHYFDKFGGNLGNTGLRGLFVQPAGRYRSGRGGQGRGDRDGGCVRRGRRGLRHGRRRGGGDHYPRPRSATCAPRWRTRAMNSFRRTWPWCPPPTPPCPTRMT